MSISQTMPSILLLEDDEDIRDFLSGLLASYGCESFLAKSLDECKNILESNDINLALLDIMLPGADGREIARFISKDYPTCSIYFMTGVEDCLSPEDREKAEGVLSKPFTIEELKEIIQKFSTMPEKKEDKEKSKKSRESLELLTAFATEYEALRRQNEKLQELLRKIPEISENPQLKSCLSGIADEHNTSLEHLRKLLEAARLSLKE